MNALARLVNNNDAIHEFDGILELMRMWRDDDQQRERDATIADIQELIDDCSQREKVEAPLYSIR